jgi:Cysteine rich repeat
MSQSLSNRILAGTLTFLGLGVVWMAIIGNLPSQQELSAKESHPPPPHAVASKTVPEPVLDLSIPGVPPAAQPPSETPGTSAMTDIPAVSMPLDRRAAQVARLRCEAEVEQLCPEAADGSGRRQCLEKRTQQLSAACQQQVRERLVRWKEERSRLILACQADIKRFCPDVRLGGGQQLQCLQQHAQELSDGCYGMLPKGTLYFKQ